MLVVYIVGWAPRHAWGGWTSAIFLDLGPNIRLGLAGIASVCSEWLSWDVVSIASSLVGPEPFAANQILSMCANYVYAPELTHHVHSCVCGDGLSAAVRFERSSEHTNRQSGRCSADTASQDICPGHSMEYGRTGVTQLCHCYWSAQSN